MSKILGDIEKVINQSKEEDWCNVFFVTSPIVAVITKLIINYFNIKTDNVIIISFRNTDLSILNYTSIEVDPKKIDRYFEKLFFLSPSGYRIQKELNKLNKKYLIFTSLATREVNWVLSSPMSMGHIYIEEGQHSYMNILPYKPDEIGFTDRLKKNWKNRFSETDEIGYYFRDDSLGFLGIFPDVFPKISEHRKFILNNIFDLKKLYKPKLKGIKTIGITCASRRLEKTSIEIMLTKLFSYLPDNSMVKVHPSFTASQKIFNDFKKKFEEVSDGKFELCSNDTIIELEMLYEPKKLIGSISSLSKYAKQLGSSYDSVKLY